MSKAAKSKAAKTVRKGKSKKTSSSSSDVNDSRFGCVDDCPFNNYVNGVCTSAKDIVEMAKQAFFVDFDMDAGRMLGAPNAIEHNPFLPTGTEPILQLLPLLEDADLGIEVHRYLEYGNLVVTHNTYTNAELFGAPTMVAFDVYRVENGQIQEHWDNLQALATSPNPDGNSMTDGPIMVKHRDETEANKAIVLEFAQKFLICGDTAVARQYVSSDTYIQHNPNIANGIDAMLAAFQSAADQGQAIVYDSIELCIAEGTFVLVAGPGSVGGVPTAFYDMFRLEDGLIVEHWDVVQEIPPDELFVHDNGKF